MRKQCLLPLIQLKLQILLLLLSDKDVAKLPREFSANRSSDRQQEFRDILSPDQSDDLAILEAKLLAIKMTLSNAGGVMLMLSSQRQEDACYIQYSAY